MAVSRNVLWLVVEGFGSSSHSVVASSGSGRFAERGGGVGLLDSGAGSPRGGNNIVRYCCIIERKFFPAWNACRSSKCRCHDYPPIHGASFECVNDGADLLLWHPIRVRETTTTKTSEGA